jgi:DNA-directed RNA polymerase subunit RPC12/RpoP
MISRSTGLKGLSRSFNGCQFDVSDGMKVVFECPACSQKLRLPIKKKTEARCGACQSFFKCQT